MVDLFPLAHGVSALVSGRGGWPDGFRCMHGGHGKGLGAGAIKAYNWVVRRLRQADVGHRRDGDAWVQAAAAVWFWPVYLMENYSNAIATLELHVLSFAVSPRIKV